MAIAERIEENNDQSTIFWDQRAQCLVLHWQPDSSPACITRVAGWQQGLACEIEDEEGCYPLPIYQDLGIDLLNSIDHPAVAQWLATIPEPVLLQVEYFGALNFILARLAAANQSAGDLLINNPVLLMLWLNFSLQHKLDDASLFAGLEGKQAEILKRMGLFASRASAKLLRRICLASIDKISAGDICRVWKNQQMVEALYHQREISLLCLKNIIYFAWSIGSPFFQLLPTIGFEQRHYVDDTLRMSSGEAINLLRACRSWQQVLQVHDRFVVGVNTGRLGQHLLRDDEGNPLPFPEPPLAGNDFILPVLTVEQLKQVGQSMEHCVLSYGLIIQQGEYFVYQYQGGEPLTIGVNVRQGKAISIDQIKGPKNCLPSAEALDCIQGWFTAVR